MALGLQPWQWGVLAGLYVVAFALPAVWMLRRARRDGEPPFVWVVLTLVGSLLGPLEYFEHRAVLKRRAKREARLKRGEGDAAEHGER